VRVPTTDEIDRITRAAIAAAVALAGQLGLPDADPQLLSNKANLLVRLAPAPVVARVATLTAASRREPAAWLAREVAVAGYVAARGGPAVAPASTVLPGPYLEDGLAITLWEYVPPSPRRAGAAEAGAALARLHHSAAGCRAELGYLTPARDQISDGLAALERDGILDSATIDALRTRHARVLNELSTSGPSIVLHGDAHPGNLIAPTAAGAGSTWRRPAGARPSGTWRCWPGRAAREPTRPCAATPTWRAARCRRRRRWRRSAGRVSWRPQSGRCAWRTAIRRGTWTLPAGCWLTR
jgi:phosphotransferase family enzyme